MQESEDFECNTEAEMNQHLLEHDAVGHHVRRSLLEWALGKEPTIDKQWKS
jgi:hypothetical protein